MPNYRLGHAAKMLGVSADTVRRMVDSGHIKTARSKGGQRQIDGAALARYMAAQPRRPFSQPQVGGRDLHGERRLGVGARQADA